MFLFFCLAIDLYSRLDSKIMLVSNIFLQSVPKTSNIALQMILQLIIGADQKHLYNTDMRLH